MKICLYSFYSGKNPEYENLFAEYTKKISAFTRFEVVEMKTKSLGRRSRAEKTEFEDKKMLAELVSGDLVIGFDEKGKSFSDSIDFAKSFLKFTESGKNRIVFLIGGPFGLGPNVKSRCDHIFSLGPLPLIIIWHSLFVWSKFIALLRSIKICPITIDLNGVH